ncbi:hypothetical protein L1887_25740 [Cichorium endivia]|nr:hypothetical protein L1887_25740 [Cichorium endivia]
MQITVVFFLKKNAIVKTLAKYCCSAYSSHALLVVLLSPPLTPRTLVSPARRLPKIEPFRVGVMKHCQRR